MLRFAIGLVEAAEKILRALALGEIGHLPGQHYGKGAKQHAGPTQHTVQAEIKDAAGDRVCLVTAVWRLDLANRAGAAPG